MTTESIPLTEHHEPPAARAPSGTRRLALAALLSGLLAVLFAGLMPLAPVTVDDPTVRWPVDPHAPQSTMLALSAYRPLGLDAHFSCATARTAATSGGVVFATIDPGVPAVTDRGLVVRASTGGAAANGTGDRLTVAGLGGTLLDQPLPAGDCDYQVRGDQGGLTVLRDGAVQARGPAGALPDVHVLATSITALSGTAALDVRLRVDDQFNTSPTGVKVLLMVLLALAVAGCFGCLVALDRRIPRDAPVRTRYRLRLVDVLVPLVMIAWVFLAPMSDDDGYYSAMARNVPFEGYVGNYYQLYNQDFTPFSWFYYVLSWWQKLGSAPVVLRGPALLCGLVTWYAIRRFTSEAKVLPTGWRKRSPWPDRILRLVLGTAFLTWWLPLDMGVRPEGVVTACGAVTLLAVTRAAERKRLLWLGIAVGVAALGFFAHPTGFTVLAPLLAGLPGAWRLLRQDATVRETAARIAAVVGPGALGVLAAFADGTLRDFVHAQDIFLKLAGQESWYTEFIRYMFLLNPSDPMANYAKRAPVLVCIAALVWFVVLLTAARARRNPVPSRLALVGWTTLFAFFLLWFTPSKWTHHFGSLAGVGSAFLALLLVGAAPLVRNLTADRTVPVPVVLAGIVSVVAMLALAGHGANKWPYSFMLGIPHANIAPAISKLHFDSPFVWFAAVAVVALVAHRLGRRRAPQWQRYSAVVAVPVVVVLYFLASTGYLVGGFVVATARTLPTWSPWAASVRDPLADRCAAADAIDVLDVRDARALPALPGGGDNGPFAEGSGWFAPAPPPAGGVSSRAWGSLVNRPGQEFPEQTTGTLRTPWFGLGTLPADTALAVAVAGRLGGGNTLTAEFGTDSGQVLARRDITDKGDDVMWRDLVLARSGQVPAGATAVRLVAVDGSTDWGGWLAVTAPSTQHPVALREYLPRDAAVAVAWQFAFLFPCQRQPEVRDGVVEPVSYAVEWGDTPFAGISDATWQPGRGGLFGDVPVSQSITNTPAWLRDFPGPQPIQVYQTSAPFPARQYQLTRQHQTLFGWEALR